MDDALESYWTIRGNVFIGAETFVQCLLGFWSTSFLCGHHDRAWRLTLCVTSVTNWGCVVQKNLVFIRQSLKKDTIELHCVKLDLLLLEPDQYQGLKMSASVLVDFYNLMSRLSNKP